MKKDLPLFFIFTILTFIFFFAFSFGLLKHIFLAAVPLGSLGIVFYHFSKNTKTPGILLIIFAISLCFGAFSHSRIEFETSSFFWGLVPSQIHKINGKIVADSVETSNHYKSFKIWLYSVSNKDETLITQAKGILPVIADTKQDFFMGQLITIKSQPIVNQNRGWFLFCGAENISVNKPSFPALQWRINILQNFIRKIDAYFGSFGSLFKALFLGIKSDIPPDTNKAFQDSGTLHLLALSGLHVGIIYLAILFLAQIIPQKTLQFLIASFCILFYLFLIGPRPSLFRASLMIILFAFGIQIKRESHGLSIISLSAIIILLLNPNDCLSLSFQFSYAAILGIAIFGPYINHLLKKYLPASLSMPLSLSISAQWTVSPLLIFHFGFINPFSILYTLVLTPLITISLWLGIILLALSFFLPASFLQYFQIPCGFIWVLIQFILNPRFILPGITISFPFLFLCFYGIVCLYLLKKSYGINIKRIMPTK
ncbi:MAG: ComEC/Rec2 family competence protein [Spirochaetales bacterium]|nr:ComEC/Rec2 family competence protein [Spirochaetales bacterium]